MKYLQIIGFVVVAAVLIGLGTWYEAQPGASVPAEPATQNSNIQTQTMENGLKITDVKVGEGATAEVGTKVTVNYSGTLDDGTKFDSSYDRKQPFSFLLGAGQVIKGWDMGVAGMKIGGKRELVIAPGLGYGAQGTGPIPPNATLYFTVELLEVQK